MRTKDIFHTNMRHFTACFLCILILASFLLPIVTYLPVAQADGERKVVRVGWHEEPYFITDSFGRSSGYTYDYQRKIAAYTGWEYEYVKGNWSELLPKLKSGEIDLLGNMSYSEERAQNMLFSSIPMGTESYYLFIATEDESVREEDPTSLNGKKVGVAKDSIQSIKFADWAATHGVTAELVEMTSSEEESLLAIGTVIDAFVTMDVYGDTDTIYPVWKIGSSDFYFAVSTSRADLLTELNAAMNSIQIENKFFSQELHEKYLRSTETDRYLTDAEKEWLTAHGTIRVGYQDNYLAFCAQDSVTGELIGALKDYLDYASTGMANATVTFEATAYPTAAAALDALKKGEVDCVFPANLTESDSEQLGVVMTPVLMTTEMDAVVRSADQKEFIRKEHVIVAVNQGNTNYDMFLIDHFPDWETKYYVDTPAGLDAVAAGEADCVIISNYRFNNIAKQCAKLRLTTVYTGVDMDYCLAVREGDTSLYSILAKTISVIPDSTIHTALTYYSTEDAKTGFIDFVRDNLVAILLGVLLFVLILVALILWSIRAERKADREERLIHRLNKQVYTDPLTSVKNKGAFADFIHKLQDRVDAGEQSEFAIGVFDCDDLKSVNDQHGHDKGDEYLKTASHLICCVYQHSPVFRIGGDEFAVILEGEDFTNREELITLFNTLKADICASAEHRWEEVHIAMGIAVYDPVHDRSVNDTARRADKIMYENKRANKENR